MSEQRIPRPEVARPGDPAPWEAAAREATLPAVTIDRVRDAMRRAPKVDELLRRDEVRTSAVLIPIWEEAGRARVLFTRRTEWLRSHSGQVSFPGGRVEDGEALVEAALRETQEEVGIPPQDVVVVGRLSRMITLSSGAGIHPFVGVLPERPVLDVNADEVARAFDVSFDDLLAPGVLTEEVWGVGPNERRVHFFEIDGETIWGATARMLYELLTLLTV